jgi:hypothetical protein
MLKFSNEDGEMKYSLDVQEFSVYLRINFSGSWTIKNGTRIIIEIDEICQRTDCRFILVDMRNATNLEFSTMRDFFVVECAANLFHGLVHKIAVLLTECDYKKVRWFETVGRNRGLNIYRYSSEVDVIRWLCGNNSK